MFNCSRLKGLSCESERVSIYHLHCLAENSTVIFSVCEVFISSRSSTVRGIMFSCRVSSIIICIQFQLFIKEYLTNWYKFCIDWYAVIFLRILAKTAWLYCKRLKNDGALNFCAIFSGPLCTYLWQFREACSCEVTFKNKMYHFFSEHGVVISIISMSCHCCGWKCVVISY